MPGGRGSKKAASLRRAALWHAQRALQQKEEEDNSQFQQPEQQPATKSENDEKFQQAAPPSPQPGQIIQKMIIDSGSEAPCWGSSSYESPPSSSSQVKVEEAEAE